MRNAECVRKLADTGESGKRGDGETEKRGAEEVAVGVEEDYQVCVRMLARGGISPSPKGGQGRKRA
jgi:hypothetical protein